MREGRQIVRMAASFLACLIGALFVAGHSRIQSMNAYHRGALGALPSPTRLYYACAPWARLVPAAMAIAALFLFKKDRASDTVVEAYVAFGWLFALAWSLGCIVAWDIPWMLIGGAAPG